ncbi:large conductance mechanosensitive channel protein MscL [Peptoniphilus sp.]|uniref:large conductance mechanosensitive channel protein MscL n=1 Tax=Peptoniphilus sp. TaxID=1971214 RepID=UPI003992DFBB
MKKFAKEFKEFISRGNVLDLAIGVIIGGAFGKIVSSLVDDIIMPLIGLATGGVDFTQKYIALDGNTYESLAKAKESTAVFAYGNFIQNIVDFLIIALVIFIVIKNINKVQSLGKKEEEVAPTTKVCPFCKSEVAIDATRCPHCTSELK